MKPVSPGASPEEAKFVRSLTRLFFASGAAGLVYQTVFVKFAGYAFGTTAYAIATVLAAFMVGLAAGSAAAGRLAARIRRPLLVYGLLELAIGAYGALTPLWFSLATRAYVAWSASADPSPAGRTAIRFLLASAVVSLPAALMGATLPSILRSGLGRRESIAARIGGFYTANLAGAALGTLVSTFLLIPVSGLAGALAVAAAVNAAIFFRCLALRTATAPDPSAPGEAPPPPGPALPRGLLLLAAAFSGASTLAYENLFSHVFGTVVGSSVYAFGTMLATILAGLALGSRLSVRAVRAGRGPQALAGALLLAPLCLALTVPLYDRVDALYSLVGAAAPSFATMEATRFVVCFAALFVPATLMGMVFPLCLEMAPRAAADAPGTVGALYALNTIASVAGSLLAGFVLIDGIGSQTSILAVGALSWLIGLLAFFRIPRAGRRRAAAAAAATAAFAALTLLGPRWNLARLTGGRWVYFTFSHSQERLLSFEEDVHGGMTTVTEAGGIRTLWTNGKFQGNDATEMRVQRGFALYPVLFLKKFDRALNIGFGTGVTAGTIGRLPFSEIDVVEIAPSMLRASRWFHRVNRGILDDPRVRVVIEDARNYLLREDRTYDLISMEGSGIWMAGAANLYSREFYELARSRLEPGGVLQQWIQLHHMDPFDLLLVLNTIRAVFPEVALFEAGHQAILVASTAPLEVDPAAIRVLDGNPDLDELRTGLPLSTVGAYLGDLLLTPAELDAALDHVVGRLGRWRRFYVSCDLWPRLEYATPRGNALRFALETNTAYLGTFALSRWPRFSEPPTALLRGAILERRGDLGAALLQYEAAGDDPASAARAAALREALLRHAPPP